MEGIVMSHLTPERCTAIRDGEQPDSHELHHLAVCVHCREQLADSRLLRTLLSAGSRTGLSSHPSAEVLAAYYDNALAPRQTARVDRHLQQCSSCAADVAALRRTLRAEETCQSPPVPAALMTRVRARFSTPQESTSLGQVAISFFGKLPPRLLHHSAFFVMASLPAAPPPIRCESPIRQFSVAAARDPYDLDLSDRMVRPSGRIRKKMPEPEPTAPLEVPAGEWTIRLQASRDDRGGRLQLKALRNLDQSPVPGLEILLVPEAGAPLQAVTDRAGEALLPLPPGNAKLRIPGRNPLELSLTTAFK
jgi:hypothetical protein